MYNEFKTNINDWDCILVKGHNPHINIMNYTKKKN